MASFVSSTFGIILLCGIILVGNGDYLKEREDILEKEKDMRIGGTISMTPTEKAANDVFMEAKNAEIKEGFKNPSNYPPGMHFFKAKPLIEKSKVFQILKKMPKGAILHGHNTAMVSSEWVIRNLTYYSNLLKCIDKDNVVILTFRQSPEYGCKEYVKVVDERAKAPNKEKYDKELEKTFNLYTPTPEVDYPDINAVWNKFQNMFTTTRDLLLYLPAFRAYHYRVLEEMHQDGVLYIEFRSSLSPIYDDNGNTYTEEQILNIMIETFQAYRKIHPDFLGCKVIYANYRGYKPTTVQEKIDLFKNLNKQFPNFMVGFDLVGQEDPGRPLIDFVSQLQALPGTGNYFFHAGETAWYGSPTDLNLLDAILLNTKRIGHGYALIKHPVLWEEVKKRKIGVEVSPISNQVLHLVNDLRNHPGSFFTSENIPMAICCDDPGFWDSKGVSYDYYYALMSFAPDNAGLEYLKKLIWNTLDYSVLPKGEYDRANKALKAQWDEFCNQIISQEIP